MGHYASEMGYGPTDDEKLARHHAERAWLDIGYDRGALEKGPIALIANAILAAIREHDRQQNSPAAHNER